jgi:hypothetical protein
VNGEPCSRSGDLGDIGSMGVDGMLRDWRSESREKAESEWTEKLYE